MSENFIPNCLELHLYYARIMKENAIFLAAYQTPKACSIIECANDYKVSFEEVLGEAICLTNNNISTNCLKCEELATRYTYAAEARTEALTKICINRSLTAKVRSLSSGNCECDEALACKVRELNEKCFCLLRKFYNWQRNILATVLRCNRLTLLYPSQLETMLHETNLYFSNLRCLSNCNYININREVIAYSQIMKNNAAVLGSMLDPCECSLIARAKELQSQYECLEENLRDGVQCETVKELLCVTIQMRDFMRIITNNLVNCRIKSTMLPLFADHLQRECNHYIKFLNCAK